MHMSLILHSHDLYLRHSISEWNECCVRVSKLLITNLYTSLVILVKNQSWWLRTQIDASWNDYLFINKLLDGFFALINQVYQAVKINYLSVLTLPNWPWLVQYNGTSINRVKDTPTMFLCVQIRIYVHKNVIATIRTKVQFEKRHNPCMSRINHLRSLFYL